MYPTNRNKHIDIPIEPSSYQLIADEYLSPVNCDPESEVV
jgi:hypothetical protein